MTFSLIKSMLKRIRDRREVPETSILDSQRDYIDRGNESLLNCAQVASKAAQDGQEAVDSYKALSKALIERQIAYNEEIEARNRSYFEDGIKQSGKIMDDKILEYLSNGGKWRV